MIYLELCSYLEYLRDGKMIESKMALEMTSKDEWENFHQKLEEIKFDIPDKTSLTEAEIRKKIMKYTEKTEPHVIASWSI